MREDGDQKKRKIRSSARCMHCVVVIILAFVKLVVAVVDADFTAVPSLVMMVFVAWMAFVRQTHI